MAKKLKEPGDISCTECDVVLVGVEEIDCRPYYKCTICGAYYEDFRGVYCLKCKGRNFDWAGRGPSVLKCNDCGTLFLRNEPEFKKPESNPFGEF